MASIKDVAKLANVGLGTASRALNESGYVAPATKARILDAAKQLNYTPSELARNLLRNRSGIIGVMIPCLDNPFFAGFTHLVESKLYTYGYKTMVCCTVNTENSEQDYLDMLQNNLVDGIITATHSFNDEAYLCGGKNIVSFDRDLGDTIPLVCSDHHKGGQLAAQCFIDKGCRKVIQICGNDTLKGVIVVNNSHKVFYDMLTGHGTEVCVYHTDWNTWDPSYYHHVIQEVFRLWPDADGIFASDALAVEALFYANSHHLSVPEDLRIVSYDGTAITRIVYPQITAVIQDLEALTTGVVDALMGLIRKIDVPSKTIIDVKMQGGGTV